MFNLINISIENPFIIWWKARRYFKFPKLRFYACRKGYMDMFPINDDLVAKWVDITFRELWWKDKWRSPRHEFNPIIKLVLFRRYETGVIFTNKVDDMIYWETILDYLYYSKNIYKSVNNNIWEDNKRSLINPYNFALNKRGKKEYGRQSRNR